MTGFVLVAFEALVLQHRDRVSAAHNHIVANLDTARVVDLHAVDAIVGEVIVRDERSG